MRRVRRTVPEGEFWAYQGDGALDVVKPGGSVFVVQGPAG